MKLLFATLLSTLLFSSTGNAGGHDQADSFAVALKVPEAAIQRVEALLNSHREFMETTHSVTGDNPFQVDLDMIFILNNSQRTSKSHRQCCQVLSLQRKATVLFLSIKHQRLGVKMMNMVDR